MAVKNVVLLLGQSNMEGRGDRNNLPVSLRGPQAGAYIFNYENNAIETLNVDGAGANLPNNTTGHIAGRFGPEMSLAAKAVAELLEIHIFKFAVDASILGPSTNVLYPIWNTETTVGLYQQFLIRWTAFVNAMTALGHTINVTKIFWFQGDSDCFVEGNDLAYFGLYKRLIKDIRSYCNPSTPTNIRWVSGLTHRLVLPNGVSIFLAQRAGNVRAAQLRAGWDDPNYRVFDSDGYSYLTDLIHLDSQGLIDIGEDMWDNSNLTYNNSMALEDYNLLSIRTRLSQDFGIDLEKQDNVIALDSKINDAISWVVNRRKNWPWLEKDGTIYAGDTSSSVASQRYGAGIFTLAQDQVFYTSFNLTPISGREIIDFVGDGLSGIMCVSSSSNTLMLKQRYRGDAQVVGNTWIQIGNPTIFTINPNTVQGGICVIPSHVPTFGVLIDGATHSTGNYNGYHYATRISDTQFSIPINSTTHILSALGVTQVAIEFTVAQAYLELPQDFIRNSTCHIEDADGDVEPLNYIHPTLFERALRDKKFTAQSRNIYSIVSDPLGLTTNKFLALYPFVIDRQVYHLKYFGDAKKLVADYDVPDIPRSDRFVVLYAAGWFAAQWQKDNELLTYYRDSALNELERMTKEYQLSDDMTEDISQTDTDSNTILRGPSTYPEFDDA